VSGRVLLGLAVALAAAAAGVVLSSGGMLVPALIAAVGGTGGGLLIAVTGRPSAAPPAAAPAAPPPPAQAAPPGPALRAVAPAAAPQPSPSVRVGPMSPVLAQAPTPVPGPPAWPADEVVGEGTISQAFVPDHTAHSMPGFAAIYRDIAAGVMRGFIMVVAGPDRGRGVPIRDGRISIGRNEGLTLTINDPGVSSHQCEIWSEGGQVMIGDAGSKNGTYVNNAPITRQPLANCDVIAFGSTKLLVTLGG
jgi:hypothetical protein